MRTGPLVWRGPWDSSSSSSASSVWSRVVGHAFRSSLQPVEIGRRLTREMDLHRRVDVRGPIAPNDFTVTLSPADVEPIRQFHRRPLARARATRPASTPTPRATRSSARSRSRSSRTRLKPGRFTVIEPESAEERGRRIPGRAAPAGRPAGHAWARRRGHRPPPRLRDRARRPQRQPPPRRDAPGGTGSSSSTSAPPTAPGSTARPSASTNPASGDEITVGATRSSSRRREGRVGGPLPENLCGPQAPAVGACIVLIFVFFLRVLWAVWAEVRRPRPGRESNGAGRRRPPVAGRAAKARASAHRLVVDTGGPQGLDVRPRRRGHGRPGRRVRGIPPRRHLRVPAPRPGVRPQRAGLRRGPRLDERHLRQRRPGERAHACTGATASRSARPCSRPGDVLRSGSATDVGRVRPSTRTAPRLPALRRRRRHGRPRRRRGGSQVAVDALEEALRRDPSAPSGPVRAVSNANADGVERAQADPSPRAWARP